MNQEMPLMASSAYASRTMGLGELYGNQGLAGLAAQNVGLFNQQAQDNTAQYMKLAMARPAVAANIPTDQPQQELSMAARRIVQVFIADPNENIPVEQCLLYRGEQKVSDATDQELFFEIDIKALLDKHNAARVKIRDKKVKERDEFLEPAKIRDLKMTVVNVASF